MALVGLKNWFKKWWAFCFPVKGWWPRYVAFKKGQGIWPIPGKPDAAPLLYLPIEWICVDLDHMPTDDDKARGFSFREIVCVDTGEVVPAGEGARCLRCGVDLHPQAAGLSTGFEAPICRRCKSRV